MSYFHCEIIREAFGSAAVWKTAARGAPVHEEIRDVGIHKSDFPTVVYSSVVTKVTATNWLAD
jgi:hypothetical protein